MIAPDVLHAHDYHTATIFYKGTQAYRGTNSIDYSYQFRVSLTEMLWDHSELTECLRMNARGMIARTGGKLVFWR